MGFERAGILLDASFLIAFHNRRDVHHKAALPVMEKLREGIWGRALLLEYVVLEVVTVLRLRRDLDTATRVGSFLLDAREIEFLPCSQIFSATFETFRLQGDAQLGFVDAAIVTAARQRKIPCVATFDADFRNLPELLVVPDPDG